MTITNTKPKTPNDRILIPILIVLVIISGTALGALAVYSSNDIKNLDSPNDITESVDIILDTSNIVSPGEVELTAQDAPTTIKTSGSYIFSGTTNQSIIVDADDAEVEIVLDGVEISTADTAAIIGLDAEKITIKTADGTTNILADGGSSQYDGCIFSNAELVFAGSGTLKVTGQQLEGEGIATEAANLTFQSGNYIITSADDGLNAGGDGATIAINGGTFYINANGDGIDSNKNAVINGGTIFVIGSDTGGDAGIDTDDGFTIDGGTIIALGTDMIEAPLSLSTQTSLAFTLDQAIAKDTTVTLMRGDKEVISFSAPKSFRTLIISSPQLTDGTYELYTSGSHTGKLTNGIYTGGEYYKGQQLNVNGTSNFVVNKIVNQYGRTR